MNVAGKCIDEQNCRGYAYYNETAGAAEWSATNCVCFDGYTNSGAAIATCDIRCHIRCKTCSGTAWNQCSSCDDGQTLSGGSCVGSGISTYYAWTRGNSWTNSWTNATGGTYVYQYTTTLSSTSTRTCGSYTSYFGYENQDGARVGDQDTDSKKVTFTFKILNNKYYALRVKLELLFIDEFSDEAGIYISRDNSANEPVYTWNFDTKEGYG